MKLLALLSLGPFLALLAIGWPGSAPAQQFPSKAVRLVNPFPPGGPLDVLGCTLSEQFGASFGVPVIVENRPGAACGIGAAEVARAAPDGHAAWGRVIRETGVRGE